MVAVATHEGAQVGSCQSAKMRWKSSGVFLPLPDVENLVDHQEAHPVGQLQQLRRRRVVAMRMALAPMSCSISSCRSAARTLKAAPSAPRS